MHCLNIKALHYITVTQRKLIRAIGTRSLQIIWLILYKCDQAKKNHYVDHNRKALWKAFNHINPKFTFLKVGTW